MNETKKKQAERRALMLKMRCAGATYKEVAESFKISTTRAREVCMKEKGGYYKTQSRKRFNSPLFMVKT